MKPQPSPPSNSVGVVCRITEALSVLRAQTVNIFPKSTQHYHSCTEHIPLTPPPATFSLDKVLFRLRLNYS